MEYYFVIMFAKNPCAPLWYSISCVYFWTPVWSRPPVATKG
jgi:hypothetical protein